MSENNISKQAFFINEAEICLDASRDPITISRGIGYAILALMYQLETVSLQLQEHLSSTIIAVNKNLTA